MSQKQFQIPSYGHFTQQGVKQYIKNKSSWTEMSITFKGAAKPRQKPAWKNNDFSHDVELKQLTQKIVNPPTNKGFLAT